MLVMVKCGVIVGMFNYYQCGEVLVYSLGLLDVKVLIVEFDLVSVVVECGVLCGWVVGDVLIVEDVE